MKECSACHEKKPLADFYLSKKNTDGFCGYCIACDKLKKAEHYKATKEAYITRAAAFAENNRDKVREYKRRWKRNHPDSMRQYKHKRRAKESVEHFTAQEWSDLLEASGHRCLACGSTENLSADHVIPLSKGGNNSIENIQPLCINCNCAKGTRTLDYREL